MFCEDCELHNRPFKKQKGITLHLLRLIKTEGQEVVYGAACVICEVKPAHVKGYVVILREKIGRMPIPDWNALIKTDPDNDGFYD
ncbi:MAG TPA: hypothetical protein VJH92_02885 [Candidatus Nanoarchaeia archaeon]|nr:hypothetical protein [Candidatus Nanoarchaeia archaeon]